jgi:hypothetical protein
VALNGWVVSSVSEYELPTSDGGSKGFSVLGYANAKCWTVVHSGGGCISELSGDPDAACKEQAYDEVWLAVS